MGADLYVDNLFDERKEKYEGAFNSAVKTRNSYQNSGDKEAESKAQERVSAIYDKMYDSSVYFRDSYNDSNMLNMFGLSWWQDFAKYLDEDGFLVPEKASAFLSKLEAEEKAFEYNISTSNLHEKETREEVVAYFRDKYKSFKEFLNTAIKTNNKIRASI